MSRPDDHDGIAATNDLVQRFGSSDVRTWMRDPDQDISFGDVFSEDDDAAAAMDVTFIRWGAGEHGVFDHPLPYDEVFVVLKGTYGVRMDDEVVTARAGEVIYLRAGATGTYFADDDAEVVAVTHPPYRKALRSAGLEADLESLRRVDDR